MSTTTAVVESAEKADGDIQITELASIEPTRVDGVGTPANGFPILMMKSIAPAPVEQDDPRAAAIGVVKGILDGTVPVTVLAKGYDESADIAGALATIKQIAQLIVSEATELGNGRLEEVWDIQTLVEAVCAMKCFLYAEQAQDGGPAADDMGGGISYKEAAEKADMSTADINDLPDSAFAYIESGGSKDESGKTTPRSKRHFPVHDKAHVRNALARAPQSPFGDKAMPKIKAAAKRYGVKTKKAAGDKATKGATMTKNTNNSSNITPDVIAKAVAEATAPFEAELTTLREQLAKVLDTPIPGGPVLVTPQTLRSAPSPAIEKATRLRAIANQTSDPETRASYLALAAREEGAPITKE